MSQKINSSQVALAIMDNLKYQTSEIQKSVDTATKSVANNTKKIIQQDAPVRRGNYKKSWKVKKIKDGSYIIHSVKHYRLTHLLEHGHRLKNGAMSKAFPHIVNGEEYAQSELPKRIEKILKDNT